MAAQGAIITNTNQATVGGRTFRGLVDELDLDSGVLLRELDMVGDILDGVDGDGLGVDRVDPRRPQGGLTVGPEKPFFVGPQLGGNGDRSLLVELDSSPLVGQHPVLVLQRRGQAVVHRKHGLHLGGGADPRVGGLGHGLL